MRQCIEVKQQLTILQYFQGTLDLKMSQYREEQALLQPNTSTLPATYTQTSSSGPIIQPALPPQSQPQPQPQPPNPHQSVQPHPPNTTNFQSTTYQTVLDIIFFFLSLVSLYLDQQISKFSVLWILLSIGNCVKNGLKPIHRAFVVVFALWFLGVLAFGGFRLDALGKNQRVFLLVYSVEVLPLICKGCCLFCCTCACATCCICVCIGSLISQACQGYMQRNKYKKTRQQLCNKNLRETTADIQCPICLQTSGQMNTQDCHHSFHPLCLQNWLKAHRTCPLCRAALY